MLFFQCSTSAAYSPMSVCIVCVIPTIMMSQCRCHRLCLYHHSTDTTMTTLCSSCLHTGSFFCRIYGFCMPFCRQYHILQRDFCHTAAVCIPSSTITDIIGFVSLCKTGWLYSFHQNCSVSMYPYRNFLFCPVSSIIHGFHGNVRTGCRKLLFWYTEFDFCSNACGKILLYYTLCAVSNLVSHRSQSCGNNIILVILYRHNDCRRFLIFFCQTFTAIDQKCNLWCIILHNNAMDAAAIRAYHLRIRRISCMIPCSDHDFSLKVRVDIDHCLITGTILHGSLFYRWLACCTAIFRYQLILYTLYSTSHLFDRNRNFKTVLPDQPVPEIFISFIEGCITNHRLYRIKLYGQRICHCFISCCIHCLEGVGVGSLDTGILLCYGCSPFCNNTGDFFISAIIHLTIQVCDSLVVRIRQNNADLIRIIPALCIRADITFY